MPDEIVTAVLSQKTVKGMYNKIVQSLFLQVEDKQSLLEEPGPRNKSRDAGRYYQPRSFGHGLGEGNLRPGQRVDG